MYHIAACLFWAGYFSYEVHALVVSCRCGMCNGHWGGAHWLLQGKWGVGSLCLCLYRR